LGDGVVQTHLPLPAEQVTRLDAVVGHLINDILGLIDRYRSIGGTDMDHSLGLAAVKVDKSLDRLGVVVSQNRVEVRAQRAVSRLDLPSLALVSAKVLNV